jgi:hypothetical protein
VQRHLLKNEEEEEPQHGRRRRKNARSTEDLKLTAIVCIFFEVPVFCRDGKMHIFNCL